MVAPSPGPNILNLEQKLEGWASDDVPAFQRGWFFIKFKVFQVFQLGWLLLEQSPQSATVHDFFFLRSNKSNFDQWFNDVPGVNRRVPGFEWLSLVSCRWLTLKFLNP